MLKLNRIHTRYSREQIEEFIESHMKEEKMCLENIEIRDDSDFEKIILAYDYSIRNSSRYQVIEEEGQVVKGIPLSETDICKEKIMITYIEELTDQEREAIREAIQLLYRQTYLLERRYDRRTEKYQYTKEYRTCSTHLEFLKDYFAVAGISLEENVHDGIIYIQGETLWGEKLPSLPTVYLLILN